MECISVFFSCTANLALHRGRRRKNYTKGSRTAFKVNTNTLSVMPNIMHEHTESIITYPSMYVNLGLSLPASKQSHEHVAAVSSTMFATWRRDLTRFVLGYTTPLGQRPHRFGPSFVHKFAPSSFDLSLATPGLCGTYLGSTYGLSSTHTAWLSRRSYQRSCGLLFSSISRITAITTAYLIKHRRADVALQRICISCSSYASHGEFVTPRRPICLCGKRSLIWSRI